MGANQPNKNSSQDFILKKEFIDLQIELRKFLDETALFTLQDLIKDPLVVHGLDDYINAHLEQYDIKKTRKTLKKLLKLKKKNVNLQPYLEEIQKNFSIKETESGDLNNKIHFSEIFEFKNSLFNLKAPKPQKEISKEMMLQIFRNSILRIENIKRLTLPKPIVNRNFVMSSSHSNLIKKIEKNNEILSKTPPQKMGNEITANMSFRNGVLKGNTGEKNYISSPPLHSNIIKATRSPYQSLTDNNVNKPPSSPRNRNGSEANEK